VISARCAGGQGRIFREVLLYAFWKVDGVDQPPSTFAGCRSRQATCASNCSTTLAEDRRSTILYVSPDHLPGLPLWYLPQSAVFARRWRDRKMSCLFWKPGGLLLLSKFTRFHLNGRSRIVSGGFDRGVPALGGNRAQ
jgi:hypothetical protein